MKRNCSKQFVRGLTFFFTFSSAGFFASARLSAQDDDEIQVDGSETVAPKTTMVEPHSNFTVDGFRSLPGSRYTIDGLFPTSHADTRPLKSRKGVTSWSGVGFYIFISYQDSYGINGSATTSVSASARPKAGTFLRPLHLQRDPLSAHRLLPRCLDLGDPSIIDKQTGRYYLSFNPTFDRAWHSPGIKDGVVFSPNIKVGVEYCIFPRQV